MVASWFSTRALLTWRRDRLIGSSWSEPGQSITSCMLQLCRSLDQRTPITKRRDTARFETRLQRLLQEQTRTKKSFTPILVISISIWKKKNFKYFLWLLEFKIWIKWTRQGPTCLTWSRREVTCTRSNTWPIRLGDDWIRMIGHVTCLKTLSIIFFILLNKKYLKFQIKKFQKIKINFKKFKIFF